MSIDPRKIKKLVGGKPALPPLIRLSPSTGGQSRGGSHQHEMQQATAELVNLSHPDVKARLAKAKQALAPLGGHDGNMWGVLWFPYKNGAAAKAALIKAGFNVKGSAT